MIPVESVRWLQNNTHENIALKITFQNGEVLSIPYNRYGYVDYVTWKVNSSWSVITNIVLHAVFAGYGVICPYWYPFNISDVCGLVNDARNLLRLNQCGRLNEFQFKYCLPDVNECTWAECKVTKRRKRRIDLEKGVAL